MPMTPLEKKWFREQVIKEYQLKHNPPIKNSQLYQNFVVRLRKLVPFNIVIGLAALTAIGLTKGWENVFQLFLSAVAGVAIISTLVSAFLKPNEKK